MWSGVARLHAPDTWEMLQLCCWHYHYLFHHLVTTYVTLLFRYEDRSSKKFHCFEVLVVVTITTGCHKKSKSCLISTMNIWGGKGVIYQAVFRFLGVSFIKFLLFMFFNSIVWMCTPGAATLDHHVPVRGQPGASIPPSIWFYLKQ